MYMVRCEGIVYFIKKGSDAIYDFASMADDIYSCKNETSAIRRHLLEEAGILNTEEEDQY